MNMNDEMICGYLVTAEQKKCNAVFLDLLREFGLLCKRANITWWVVFGALIGAVRHKGFIPWDDDVDVAMPRKDFDRLAAMTNEAFGAEYPYFLQNPVTDPGYGQIVIRFRRSDTTFIQDFDLQEIRRMPGGCPYNMGLDLTILPVDGYPKSKFVQGLQPKAVYLLKNAYYRAYTPEGGRQITYRLCHAIKRIIGDKAFFRLAHWPYRWRKISRSDFAQVFQGTYSSPTTYKAEDFASTVRLPFEDVSVPVPAGYDDFLSRTYKNYMEFPPPEKRVPKHGGYVRADVPYAVSAERLRSGEVQFPKD